MGGGNPTRTLGPSVEPLGGVDIELARLDVDALVADAAVEGDDLEQFQRVSADGLEPVLRVCAA